MSQTATSANLKKQNVSPDIRNIYPSDPVGDLPVYSEDEKRLFAEQIRMERNKRRKKKNKKKNVKI